MIKQVFLDRPFGGAENFSAPSHKISPSKGVLQQPKVIINCRVFFFVCFRRWFICAAVCCGYTLHKTGLGRRLVRALVSPHGIRSRELLPTDLTVIRFLTSVYTPVNSQGGLLCKCLAAEVAGEWTVPTMRSAVYDQLVLLQTALGTHCTHTASLRCVFACGLVEYPVEQTADSTNRKHKAERPCAPVGAYAGIRCGQSRHGTPRSGTASHRCGFAGASAGCASARNIVYIHYIRTVSHPSAYGGEYGVCLSGQIFWDRVHTDTVSDPCGSSCGPGGYHVGQSFFHRLYTGVASHLCASVDACSGHTAAQIPCCRIHSSNASCWHHFPISYDWFSLSSRGLRSVQCLSWYGLRCLY